MSAYLSYTTPRYEQTGDVYLTIQHHYSVWSPMGHLSFTGFNLEPRSHHQNGDRTSCFIFIPQLYKQTKKKCVSRATKNKINGNREFGCEEELSITFRSYSGAMLGRRRRIRARQIEFFHKLFHFMRHKSEKLQRSCREQN